MNMEHTDRTTLQCRSLSFIVLTVLFLVVPLRSGIAQTNLTQGGSQTNTSLARFPAPTDFQRLQYYYAAAQGSPAPGSEHGIFTLRDDNAWNGDWNSSVVAKPSREQLNAINFLQVDLFNRAAVYTNSIWQIVTSETNVPLSALNISPSTYTQIRATATRDQQLATCQQIQTQITQSQSISP